MSQSSQQKLESLGHPKDGENCISPGIQEGGLDAASQKSSQQVSASGNSKSVKEIEDEFAKIKERLRKEKNDGSRSKFKSMVQSLKFDNLDTFGEEQDNRQPIPDTSDNNHTINPSKDFEEISLCQDGTQFRQSNSISETQQNIYHQNNYRCSNLEDKPTDGNLALLKSVDCHQGYTQQMMEKFSAPQEIEEQMTDRGVDISQEMVHHSQIIEQATQNAVVNQAFDDPAQNQLAEGSQQNSEFDSPTKKNIQESAAVNNEDTQHSQDKESGLPVDEDNILSRSSQKKKKRDCSESAQIEDEENENESRDQLSNPTSSRSSQVELAQLQDRLQDLVQNQELSARTSQLKNKFMRILSQNEVVQLSDNDKQDYIYWLKEEIHNEIKRELKFKCLQDDLGLLHKNFALEEELHKSEMENRKLQIWILEDKQEQLQSQILESEKESQQVLQMLDGVRIDIQKANEQLQEKDEQIDQVKEEIKDAKKTSEILKEQQEEDKQEYEKAEEELKTEQERLNQEVQLKEGYNANLEEVNNFYNEISESLNGIRQDNVEKEEEIRQSKEQLSQIQEDIQDAENIIEKLKDEKDMYETQKSFMQKKKALVEKEIAQKNKKKKFDHDFIQFGHKSNKKLNDEVEQTKVQINELKKTNLEITKCTKMLQIEIKHSQSQIQTQERINLLLHDKYQDNGKEGHLITDDRDSEPGIDSSYTPDQAENQEYTPYQKGLERRPSMTDAKNQHDKCEFATNVLQSVNVSSHLKSKSIQDHSKQYQAQRNEVDPSQNKEFCTWRESITLTEDSGKPLNVNSSCANTNRPMTQDALKKFLDNKFNGLRHPKLQDQNAILQKLTTLESHPSTDQLETLRTHDDQNLVLNRDETPTELYPRDLDESQSNYHRQIGHSQMQNYKTDKDYQENCIVIEQNNFKQESRDQVQRKQENYTVNNQNSYREKAYDLPRKQCNKENELEDIKLPHHEIRINLEYQKEGTATSKSNLQADKYSKYFTSQTMIEHNRLQPYEAQKTERESYQSQSYRFIEAKRNKSTEAKSDVPQARNYLKKEQLTNYEKNYTNDRSFNVSQAEKIGSDQAKQEKVHIRSQESDRQHVSAVLTTNSNLQNQKNEFNYYAEKQNQLKAQEKLFDKRERSERSKEREAILKQTQELIKKSQDRLRWHQSENKNIHSKYSFERLKNQNAEQKQESNTQNQVQFNQHHGTSTDQQNNFDIVYGHHSDPKLPNYTGNKAQRNEIKFDDYRNLRASNTTNLGDEKRKESVKQSQLSENKFEKADLSKYLSDSHSQSFHSYQPQKQGLSKQHMQSCQNNQSTDRFKSKTQFKSKFGETLENQEKGMANKLRDSSQDFKYGIRKLQGQTQLASDAVSSTSIDNILKNKTSVRPEMPAASNRQSRSKDEVQNNNLKRTASQSSQYKSRAAMRVLGITQGTEPQSQHQNKQSALSNVDPKENYQYGYSIRHSVQALPSVKVDDDKHKASAVSKFLTRTPDQKPHDSISLKQWQYSQNKVQCNIQSRNQFIQGTLPVQDNEKNPLIDFDEETDTLRRRKSEMIKEQNFKRNHSSYSAVELQNLNSNFYRSQLANQKVQLHQESNQPAKPNHYQAHSSIWANNFQSSNLRSSHDVTLKQNNYQVRFESNENNAKLRDTDSAPNSKGFMASKSAENKFERANYLIQKNAKLKEQVRAEPQSSISLKNQNRHLGNHLQSVSAFDDCRSSKSYGPVTSYHTLTVRNNQTNKELGQKPLEPLSAASYQPKRMESEQVSQNMLPQSAFYSAHSQQLQGKTDRSNHQKSPMEIQKMNSEVSQTTQQRLGQYSAVSVVKEELKNEYLRKEGAQSEYLHQSFDTKKKFVGYKNDSQSNQYGGLSTLQQKNQQVFDRLEPQRNSFENLKFSKRSIMDEEIITNTTESQNQLPKYSGNLITNEDFTDTANNHNLQSYINEKSTIESNSIYYSRLSNIKDIKTEKVNTNRVVEDNPSQTDLQKMHIKNIPEERSNRVSSKSPDNILGFRSKFAQKQFTDAGQKSSRNNHTIEILDQQQRTHDSRYQQQYQMNSSQQQKGGNLVDQQAESNQANNTIGQYLNQSNLGSANFKTSFESQKIAGAIKSEPNYDLPLSKQQKNQIYTSKVVDYACNQNSQIHVQNQYNNMEDYSQKDTYINFRDQPYQSHAIVYDQAQNDRVNQKQPQQSSSLMTQESRRISSQVQNSTAIDKLMDDIKETKLQKSVAQNKCEEPEMKYTTRESPVKNQSKNDSIDNIQVQKDYVFFRPLESQTITSSHIQTGHLGSTIGQVLTPNLYQNAQLSQRSIERLSAEHRNIGSIDGANMSYKNLGTFNQNVFQQMETQKEAVFIRRMTENEENLVSILKQKNDDQNVASNQVKQQQDQQRQSRQWGNFKSSFAKREMSRDSRERPVSDVKFGKGQCQPQTQTDRSSAPYNVQIASNNANVMDMPQQYVPGQYEMSAEYDDRSYAGQQNMHTFNRRQYEDQPKSISNSSQKHTKKGSEQHYGSNENDQGHHLKLEPNSQISSTKDLKKMEAVVRGNKLSQFLKPNLHTKVEISSLANITEQVMTGNIKDYKQQQSQQILKMQQELQRMQQEQGIDGHGNGQRVEPHTAVPVGFKRKGSQDFTLDLSMEDKLSEQMFGHKKSGNHTPFVIHQDHSGNSYIAFPKNELCSEYQTQQTVTQKTVMAAQADNVIYKHVNEAHQQLKHVEFDSSDAISSSLVNPSGSAINSQDRVAQKSGKHRTIDTGNSIDTPEHHYYDQTQNFDPQSSKEEHFDGNTQTREYDNLENTAANLSLEEQADIINQLRSSKSQRGKFIQ